MKKYYLLLILLMYGLKGAATASCVYDPMSGGTGGIVTASDPDGDCHVTLTATPTSGYTFLYWDDDHSNTDPVRVVTLPEYDDLLAHVCAWTAVFTKDIRHCWDQTYYDCITASSGGSVSATYDEVNERYVLTASNSSGYVFKRWSDGVTATTRYITITESDSLNMTAFTFTAEFEKEVSHCWDQTYYDCFTAGSGGSVSATYDEVNERYELTASNSSGYVFKQWSDGVTATTRYITITESDSLNMTAFTFTAEFEKEVSHCWDYTYYDHISSNAGGKILVEQDDVNYRYKLTARKASGYLFHHWKDLGYTDGTDSIRYITPDLSKDKMLYEAVFEKTVSYCWDCTHYDPVTADAHGSVSVTAGSDECEWIIEATPDEGYVFARWEDDDTAIENPRTVTIDDISEREFTYTAVFVRSGDVSVDAWGTSSATVTTVSRRLDEGTAEIYKDGTLLTSNAISTTDAGVYSVPFTGVTSRAGQEVHIVYVNRCDEICAVTDTIVPVIVSTATDVSALSLPANIGETDIHILNGATLTFDASSTTLAGLDIYAGGKAVIPSGTTVNVSSVTMRGDGPNARYPQLVANGTLNNDNSDTVYYDYILDYSAYYPLAVPYNVIHTAIRDRVVGTAAFEVGGYDGATRATGASGWGGVFDDTKYDIPAGEGFTVFAVPRLWNDTRQATAVVRFPMVADLTEGETTKTIAVSTYGDAATKVNDRNWNFIGNPYLADITGDIANDDGVNISVGMFEKTLVNGVWYGEWHYTGDLRYVTIPADGFTSYTQEPVKTADLKAFNSYFVQASADGYLSFAVSRRSQDAPARRQLSGSYSAADISHVPELAAGLTLRQGDSSDHTGLLLGAAFTAGYDYNADLAKMFGSRQSMVLYALADDNMPLAYTALPAEETSSDIPYHEVTVPLGYRNASIADAVFAFDSARYTISPTDDSRLTALLLTDRQTGAVSDLLTGDYRCLLTRTSDDTRFILTARYVYQLPEQSEQTGVATGLWTANGQQGTDTDSGKQTRPDGVYDVLGRKVADKATGVYIIVENGKVRKEVVR